LAILRTHAFRRFSGDWRAMAAQLALAITLVLTVVTAEPGQAATFNVIHAFTGQSDGANPYAGLSMDGAGNLYSTTSAGGAGFGTVFELKRSGSSWIANPLYSFTGGDDGAQPRARVVIGPDGSLYGTTFNGGGAGCAGRGCGTVFNLRPNCKGPFCTWTETVLYRFTGGTDGGQPLGDLVLDQAGNIYGTTQQGGLPRSCGNLGCGVVYKLTRSGEAWTESLLYEFSGGSDGDIPNGGVVFDRSGNLFGTTLIGGANNYGTIFQLTPSGSGWTHNVLYSFQNLNDGSEPDSGLMFDPRGNLCGTTIFGGAGGGGTVFKLKRSGGNWILKVVYSLTGNAGPFASLTVDAAGNLYGTTGQDGAYRVGSGFKLTHSQGSWTYTSFHDFTGGSDGELPLSNLVFDSSGKMYGTAAYGGANGYGVVVEITP
jgi:uncharacterized repeat protein (TIGR03803 family)